MNCPISRIASSLLTLLFLAFLFVVSSPGPVFSRAGGGHSYSSGGSSSHSSGSSGSSGRGSSGFHGSRSSHPPVPLNPAEEKLLFLVFLVGGCLIVLKIAVDYKDRNTNNALNEARSEKAPKLRSQPASDRANAIKALSARDPKWDSARFLERVKNGFSQIQTAWSNQDLNTVQGFLSDGVFERFTLQIQEQKDDGIRDHMEALRILHARIMQVEMDSRFDTIHVSIRASAVNY
ncbi:MAG TPA: TIM44-like domain-containing protein, partial [Candidatus Ozemobacteraceae bacterium]|nr:TIM44-like domain-containing protein [Candidatus Ozemobacteraceae bacterium]